MYYDFKNIFESPMLYYAICFLVKNMKKQKTKTKKKLNTHLITYNLKIHK